MHNKPDMLPLDVLTKSGKLIQRIISEFPGRLFVKTNLYDIEYYPRLHYIKRAHAMEWLDVNWPVEKDIIVLLGYEVHKNFIYDNCICDNIVKAAHPSSQRSNVDMDSYVKNNVEKIKKLLVKFELI